MKYKVNDIIIFSSEKYNVKECRARITSLDTDEIFEIEPLNATFDHGNFRMRRRHYPVTGDIVHGLYQYQTLPEDLFTI